MNPGGYEHFYKEIWFRNNWTGAIDIRVRTGLSPLFDPNDGNSPRFHDVLNFRAATHNLKATHYTVWVWFGWWWWDGEWKHEGEWKAGVANQFFLDSAYVCDTYGDPTEIPIGVPIGGRAVALRNLRQLSVQEGSRSVVDPLQATALTRTPRCFAREATIVGTRRADNIVGTPRRDVIVGLGGKDHIEGRGGSDFICGGGGVDEVLESSGANRIAGDAGGDVIIGGVGRDTIVTGPGLDIVEGRAGVDSFRGDKLDILAYLFSPSGVKVDFAHGTARDGWGTTTRETFIGFGTVVGSDFDDRLLGSTGPQWFVPLLGDDVVDGAVGTDVIAYFLSSNWVDVNLSEGTGSGEGEDLLDGIDVVFGSDEAVHGDFITGDASFNWLFGGGGGDSLDGVAGGDSIEGGSGVDNCTNGGQFTDCENQGPGIILVAEPPTAPVPIGTP